MRDFLSWSLYLGRWGGVQIRLHALFFLLAAGVYQLALAEPTWTPWHVAALVGTLLLSVLLHELAHAVAARRLGGACDQAIVWPLGGLVSAVPPHEPRAEMLVALAGPLMNLLIAVATLPALVALKWDLWSLINPLTVPLQTPEGLAGLAAPLCLAWLFWLNWVLVLINLLPAHPLDGGRLMRAGLWLGFGYRPAVLGASRIAQITAIWLGVVAWLLPDDVSRGATLPLLALAVLLYFEARHELARHEGVPADETALGYDFSQGCTSLERVGEVASKTDSGPVRRWLEERREARQERQRQIEVDEERRVDEILAMLHERGLSGLSPEDRALLDRVSARYRNRH